MRSRSQFRNLLIGKKGSVSFFVLLFILAALLFFQSYLSFTTADYNTGWDLDNRTQRIVEEANLRIIVKQALLTYYERGYFVDSDASSVSDLINSQLTYLNQDSNGNPNGVIYSLSSTPSLPDCGRSTFWEFLNDSGTTNLNGAFNLVESNAPRDFDHVNDFLNPQRSAFEVQNAGDTIFPFSFACSDGSTITVNARMWQVPVTDFNIFAYGYPVEGGIPVTPPSMSNTVLAGLENGSLRGISLSQINSISGNGRDKTTYPFYYRELFSAGAQVWQSLFYSICYYNVFLDSKPVRVNISQSSDNGTVISQLTYKDVGDDDVDAYWELDVNGFSGNLLVTGAATNDKYLNIVDSGSNSTDDPLIVYLMAREGGPIQVHLNGVYNRPMLLICENAEILLDGNTVVNGGIFDGGDSSFTDHTLTVNGTFAFKAVSGNVSSVNVGTYNTPSSLRYEVPRFLLVDTF